MVYVYAKNNKRRSFASKLARALRVGVVTPTKAPTEFPAVCVNWGCSDTPIWPTNRVRWLGNNPRTIATISHKVRMFTALSAANIPCIEWTREKQVAEAWRNARHTVYERAVLQGHSGDGIRVVTPDDEDGLADVPLYTKGIRQLFNEFRVHVLLGRVICVQRKRQLTAENAAERGLVLPDKKTRVAIRTYQHGWMFCVNKLFDQNDDEYVRTHSARLSELAVQAMRAVGGRLGAVDIMYLPNEDQYLVIETNSAPALRSPTVLRAYRAGIQHNYFNVGEAQ